MQPKLTSVLSTKHLVLGFKTPPALALHDEAVACWMQSQADPSPDEVEQPEGSDEQWSMRHDVTWPEASYSGSN